MFQDRHPFRLSRRKLVQRTALTSIAGLVAGAGLGTTMRRRGAARQAASGSIVVSFADDSGTRQPFVEQAARDVQAARPDAEITIDAQEIPSTDFTTRFFLAARSGTVPDVFHLTGATLGALAASGAARPLDDFVAEWPDWEHYPAAARESVTYDGKIWAIPYGLDSHYLYYRKDVFEQAGLPREWSPANVAGILEAARAVKENVPEVIPYALYAGETGGTGSVIRGFLPLLWAYGGTLHDAQGKWIIDSPAIRQAFAYYAQAYRTDQLVPPQLLSTPNPSQPMRERLGQGKLAILYEGMWAYGPWQRDNADQIEQIGYLLHPTAEGGPSFTVGGSGQIWFISATSQAPELAWEFLKALNTPATVAALNLADPHVPARSDVAAQPAFQEDAFLANAANDLSQAMFAPQHPAYVDLIPMVQRATGVVATGEAEPDDAAARYAEDLARVLGADQVVSQS